VYITSWVGQNHICTVYIWYLWLRNHQIYNHIRRIHTVLANPSYKDVQRFLDVVLYGAPIHFSSFHLQRIYAVLLEANSFEMCVSWAQAIIKGSRPSSLHAAWRLSMRKNLLQVREKICLPRLCLPFTSWPAFCYGIWYDIALTISFT